MFSEAFYTQLATLLLVYERELDETEEDGESVEAAQARENEEAAAAA